MFKYDVLIEEKDICNYEDEISQLKKLAGGGEKIVLFAPRRYGKTSILINVVGKWFIENHNHALFCYVNLQQAKDFDSMAARFSHSIEEAVGRAFPLKTIVSNVVKLMASLRPQVEMDPISGEAKLTLTLGSDKRKGLQETFHAIETLSRKYPLLLAMDEFQDVTFIPEAEALIRQFLEKLVSSSVIISGSKKHILKDIFLNEQKPFYNWGKTVELKRIPFEQWKKYITQRFKYKKLTISDNVLTFLLNSVCYIPNYICKLCSDIYNEYEVKDIIMPDIAKVMHDIYLNTQSRYAEKIAFLTKKQLQLLVVISKNGTIAEITSTKTAAESGISTRGLSTINKMLLDKGYTERDEHGIRTADPFFAYYLSREF